MRTRDRVRCLFYCTNMSQREIAERAGVCHQTVSEHIRSFATPAERKARHSHSLRRVMPGKCPPRAGAANPNWKGGSSTSAGYRLVPVPDWWVGTTYSAGKYVREHQAVACAFLGLTALPAGYCVHHRNRDKTDNRIDNLELMTLSAHMKLHGNEDY